MDAQELTRRAENYRAAHGEHPTVGKTGLYHLHDGPTWSRVSEIPVGYLAEIALGLTRAENVAAWRARVASDEASRERIRAETGADPLDGLAAEELAEASRVAEFARSTPGLLARMVELLESIDARLEKR